VCALEIPAMAVQGNECGTSEMGSCWYHNLLTNLSVSELRECDGLHTQALTRENVRETLMIKLHIRFMFKH